MTNPQDWPGGYAVVGENDALPLEYKLLYGCARRNVDIADFVNKSASAFSADESKTVTLVPSGSIVCAQGR